MCIIHFFSDLDRTIDTTFKPVCDNILLPAASNISLAQTLKQGERASFALSKCNKMRSPVSVTPMHII